MNEVAGWTDDLVLNERHDTVAQAQNKLQADPTVPFEIIPLPRRDGEAGEGPSIYVSAYSWELRAPLDDDLPASH